MEPASTILPHERSPFIGRAREIRELVERARSGEKCFTFVGPVGVGKSRLAQELIARLGGDGRVRTFESIAGAELTEELGDASEHEPGWCVWCVVENVDGRPE